MGSVSRDIVYQPIMLVYSSHTKALKTAGLHPKYMPVFAQQLAQNKTDKLKTKEKPKKNFIEVGCFKMWDVFGNNQ